MKKIAYLLTLVIGAWELKNTYSIYTEATEFTKRGIQPLFGPANISSYIVLLPLLLISLLLVVGGYGGLTKQKWAYKIASIGLIAVTVVYIYTQDLSLIIPAIILGLLFWSNKK